MDACQNWFGRRGDKPLDAWYRSLEGVCHFRRIQLPISEEERVNSRSVERLSLQFTSANAAIFR